MKVNIDIQHLCTNNLRGIPQYILSLTQALAKRNENDYSVSFFDLNQERGNRKYIDTYLANEIEKGLRVIENTELSYNQVIQSNVLADASEYDAKTYEEYMQTGAEVVHFTQSLNIPYNITGKIIVTVHDVIPLLPGAEKYCTERSLVSFKNNIRFLEERKDITIITDSESTKKDILHYTKIEKDRIYVVPLAYDEFIHFHQEDVRVLEKYEISENPFLLYLGAIEPRKGIVEILEAFERTKPFNKDLKLVIAGKIDQEMMEKGEFSIAKKLNNYLYKEDVVFTGFVTDEEKRALMSSAKIFLFPSEYEGFGLPILEAMACGAPVITSKVSSIPEVGGDAVIYTALKDVDEFASKIKQLLDSEDLREIHIQKGYEQAKCFSWEKTAELTEKVYTMVQERN